MRYQFTLTRMAVIKKTDNITKKGETGPSYVVTGNVKGAAALENSLAIPQNVKHRFTV